jgi:hypothetical protein
MIAERTKYKKSFIKPLRQVLTRYQLTFDDNQEYFCVNNTGSGGFYREVPEYIVAKLHFIHSSGIAERVCQAFIE